MRQDLEADARLRVLASLLPLTTALAVLALAAHLGAKAGVAPPESPRVDPPATVESPERSQAAPAAAPLAVMARPRPNARAVIVPTADTPWPAGHNALWCTTIEMAWREFGRAALGGTPQPPAPRPAIACINAAPLIDLPEGSWFVRAGPRTRQAIHRARKDLFERFPNAIDPPLSPSRDGWFSFAYLEVLLTFRHAFQKLEHPLYFGGPGGKSAPVEAFGIEFGSLRNLRRQVAVLYDERDTLSSALEGVAAQEADLAQAEDPYLGLSFVLDLDRTSAASQMILARVKREGTLQRTWANVAALVRKGGGDQARARAGRHASGAAHGLASRGHVP